MMPAKDFSFSRQIIKQKTRLAMNANACSLPGRVRKNKPHAPLGTSKTALAPRDVRFASPVNTNRQWANPLASLVPPGIIPTLVGQCAKYVNKVRRSVWDKRVV